MPARRTPGPPPGFDVPAFLHLADVARRSVKFAASALVFAQGGQANSVFYIQSGGVKLSVLSAAGKEAVVAMLGPGDFFGEGCLAGQPLRMGTATAVVTTTALLRIPKREMIRMLHEQPEFSDRFIAHMLARNIRIEEDLVDQLFNSSEKRLARTLLLLARYGKEDTTAADAAEAVAGDAGRDGRHDAVARELLHEQVPQARIHRIQRRPQDQQLAAEHRPARLSNPRGRRTPAWCAVWYITRERRRVQSKHDCPPPETDVRGRLQRAGGRGRRVRPRAAPVELAVAVSLAALPGLGIVQLWGHPTEPQPHEQPIGASMPWTSPAVKRSLWAVVVVAIAAAGSTAHAIDADAVFSHYRTLALGDSVPAVVETLKARPTDVKIVQERPTLIQQLTWRRQRYVSGESAVVDPVDEMVLTFHLGQLTRIAVSYERNRTEGLTDADLTDAFVDVYGPPMLPSTSSHTTRVKSAPGAALGLWSDGVTLVTLRREGHPPQLKLTVATLVADAAMQEALADGAELAASEAPGKALAKSTADAAELLARADRIRRDNKASFKP